MSKNAKTKSQLNEMVKKIQFIPTYNKKGGESVPRISKASQKLVRDVFGLQKKQASGVIKGAEEFGLIGKRTYRDKDLKLREAFAFLAELYNEQTETIAKETKIVDERKKKSAKKIQELFKKKTKKVMVSININIKLYSKHPKSKKIYLSVEDNKQFSGTILNTPKSIKDFVYDAFNKARRGETNWYKETYRLTSLNTFDIPKYSIDNTRKYLQLSRIQLAGVLELDSEKFKKNPEWCKNRNMCFPDYIQYRLGREKGFIKKVTDEKIQELSLLDDEGFIDHSLDPYPNKNGYTIDHITNYAKQIHASLYILSDDEIIYDWVCQTGRISVALVFEIKNNHLYPILDKFFVKSIVSRQNNVSVKSNNLEEKQFESEPKEYTIIKYDPSLKNDEDGAVSYAIQIMHKKGIQNYDKKLIIHNGELSSFVLDKKKYLTFDDEKEQHTIIKQYCKDNNIVYQGQSPQYFVKDYIDKFESEYVSYFNKDVENALIRDGVKHRVHLGKCHPDFDNLIQDVDNILCWDIVKNYRYAMECPYEDFMIIDFYQNIKYTNKYEGFGLYFVVSSDSTLLFGNNWYSWSMVSFAQEQNIDLEIQAFIPGRSVGKNIIKDMIDEMTEDMKDENLVKLVCNSLYGWLAKTESNKTSLKVDTDHNKVWDNYMKYKGINNEEPVVFSTQIDKKTYYAYGNKINEQKKSHNLPMAIQIQDHACIQLYKMIQKMGGELLYRKTDMAICHNPNFKGKRPKCKGEMKFTIGDYRTECMPENFYNMKAIEERNISLPKIEEWNQIEYDVSDQYEPIIDYAIKNKGLQLLGRAGTGKTFVALKGVEKCQKDKITHTKLAFTNKACINLKGSTIHSFMKLNRKGKLSSAWARKVGQKLQLVFVDEISMIDGHLWKLLAEFKQITGCIFIIIGDYRQLPPVCDEAGNWYDWFNHPSVRYLANNNRCELSRLSKNSRYGIDMWNFLEDIWNQKYSFDTKKRLENIESWTIEDLIGKTNISYSNNTRMKINSLIQDELCKGKEYKEIEYDETVNVRYGKTDEDSGNLYEYLHQEKKEKYHQTSKLFVGAKLLMFRTTKDKTLKKNETVYVIELGEESFLIKNSEGLIAEFRYDEFHKDCLLGYCTTIHKSQGDTVEGRLNIFDIGMITHWLKDKRCLYTALSRAKNLESIHLLE